MQPLYHKELPYLWVAQGSVFLCLSWAAAGWDWWGGTASGTSAHSCKISQKLSSSEWGSCLTRIPGDQNTVSVEHCPPSHSHTWTQSYHYIIFDHGDMVYPCWPLPLTLLALFWTPATLGSPCGGCGWCYVINNRVSAGYNTLIFPCVRRGTSLKNCRAFSLAPFPLIILYYTNLTVWRTF